MTSTKTATFIKKLEGWSGDARLYGVTPKVVVRDWYDQIRVRTDYVVVSAVVAPITGPETYIFAADQDGEVQDWGELDGSFRGALDHEGALRGAGYTIEGRGDKDATAFGVEA